MFCAKCGKEVFDEAVFCPGCGCLLVKNAELKKAIKKNEQRTSFSIGFVHVLLFISFGLMCATGVSLYFSIVHADLYFGAFNCFVAPNDRATLIALICIISSVVTGGFALIFAFIDTEKDWLTVLTILNAIIAVAMLVMAIIGRAQAV